VEPMGVEPTTS